MSTKPVESKDARMDALERRIAALSEQLKRVIDKGGAGEDSDAGTQKDEIWSCAKCGRLLGFYDRDRNEIRVRYRGGHLIYFEPGIGGMLRTACWGCGEMNVCADVPDDAPEGVEDVEVADLLRQDPAR